MIPSGVDAPQRHIIPVAPYLLQALYYHVYHCTLPYARFALNKWLLLHRLRQPTIDVDDLIAQAILLYEPIPVSTLAGENLISVSSLIGP